MLVEALSTGHKVGLGVTAAAFIAFALLSAFVFPRIRASYPGRGLPAFIVVCLVFFFGMLTAVENFGGEASEAATETTSTSPTSEAQTTTTQATTTAATTTVALPPATTTTAKPKPKPPAAQTIPAVETEFKITLSKPPKAGPVTFDVKNVGKLPHDFVVQGGGVNEKTPTLDPGATAKLKVTLKPGSYDVYCSIPGHKQAGMDVKLNVGS